MAAQQPHTILRQMRQMVGEHHPDLLLDRQLIDRFVRYREVSAFDILHQRYGPMVLRVCRRILRDRHAAEDAAQATFLVLVRKAGSVKKRESLASWLYRVAVRIAVRARADADKSLRRVAPASSRRELDPAGEASHRELCAILDEEVLRLPERFRTPVLLCYVEGQTRDQTAQQLGWSLRTLQRRLEQGRELLRRRLTRRGATLSAALLAAGLLEPGAEAGVIAPIFQVSRISGSASNVSARAAFLTDRFIRSIAVTQMKRLCAVILTVTVFTVCAGVAAYAKWPDATPKAPGPQPPAGGNAKPPRLPAFIYGVVQDEWAKPVGRARVWLREGTMPPFHFRAVDADEQGRFNINLTEPDTWATVTLVALAKGYGFTGRHVTMQAGQPAQKVVLTLNSPEELRLRVVNEVGQPVQGAALDHIAWKTDNADLFWLPLDVLTLEEMARPVSNKDGMIILSGIPKGAMSQGCVKHPDFARQTFDGIEAGKKPVEMKLTLGYALTIIAMNGSTKKPAPGAFVRLWAREYGSVFEMADREGRVTIRLADARDVHIKVTHPDLMSPRWVDIPRWSAVSGSVLVMELFPKVTVTGRCVDERTGKPVPGIRVGAAAHGVRQNIGGGFTDADGRYEIEALEGLVEVEAQTGADRHEPRKVEADTTKTTRLPDLKLKLLPMVRGKVVGTDGKPVSGAFVMYAWSPIRSSSILTDKDGRFEFRMYEDEFGVAIVALHPTERESGGEYILIEELNAGKEMQISLQPEYEIRGTVVDGDGKPRAGVQVGLEGKTEYVGGSVNGVHESTFTNAKGSYRFQGLSRDPKQYCIRLVDSSGELGPRSKWITPAEKTITVDPLTATERFLKAKPNVPSPTVADELRCRQWLNSQPIKVESLRGKVVLLAFGATWSKQSADDLTEIQLAHQLYADKGLVVIGVHHHGERFEEVAAFAAKKNLTFPIGVDNGDAETFDRYGVNYYPRCLLISRDGKRVPDAWDNGNFLAAVRKAVLYDR